MTANSEITIARNRRLALAWLVAAILGAGAGVVGVGLLRFDMGFPHPWRGPASSAVLLFVGAYWFVATLCFCLGRPYRAGALVLAFVLWLIIAGGLGPVFAVMLIAVPSLLLGELVVRANWTERFGRPLAALMNLSVGLGLYTAAINYASHFKVNFLFSYILASALVVALGWRRLLAYLRYASTWLAANGAHCGPIPYIGLALLIFVLALQSVFASLPEQYHDALATHLMVALKMAQTGSWAIDPAHLIGSMTPQGANWLFSAGAILAGESGAKIANLCILLTIVGLVGTFISSHHGTVAGLIGGALFASMPITFIVTASLFSENPLALFATALGVLLTLTWRDLRRSDAFEAGILMGAAALVKLHGLLFLAPFVLLFSTRALMTRGLQAGIIVILVAAVTAAVTGLEPYIHAYFATGNPVYPFFNAWFKSPLFDSSSNFSDSNWVGKLSWYLPFHWTFESSRFLEAGNGAIGFALLALLPAGLVGGALARDRVTLIAAAVGLGYLALIAPATQYLRYAYYALPLLTIASAGLLLHFPPRLPLRVGVLAIGTTLVLLALYCIPAGGWILHAFPLDVLLNRSKEQAWLSARVPQRQLIEIINAHAGESARVLILGQPVGSGLKGQAYYLNWYNPRMAAEFAGARTREEIGRLMMRFNLTHIMAGPPALSKEQPLMAYISRSAIQMETIGGVTLYKILPTDNVGEEIIRNGDFAVGLTEWDLGGEVRLTTDMRPLMAPLSQLAQAATITAGGPMKFSARILCGVRRSDLQLQVNWLTDRGGILATNMEMHECSYPGSHTFSTKFIAPPNARAAYFYLKSIGGEPFFAELVSVRLP